MATQGNSVVKTVGWLYHESGISAVWATGKDAWLIILSRTCRMFAFKAVTLTISAFFSNAADLPLRSKRHGSPARLAFY